MGDVVVDQVALDQAGALTRAVRRRPVLIGIDGQSGAGKSTFAAQLLMTLDEPVVLVQGDDFYRDMPDLERVSLNARQGFERFFDWQRLRREVLEPVACGKPTFRYQRYDWNSASMGQWVRVTTPDILVVEGVYTLRPELRDLFDVKLFVSTDDDVRLKRQIDRGENSNEWIQRWAAAEALYMSEFSPRTNADVVVQGL